MHTVAVDWIIGLPIVNAANTPWSMPGFETFDTLFTTTDKFSKRTLLVPGHSRYAAEEWAIIWVKMLTIADWGLPKAIISDRDLKFHAAFWQ